MSGPPTRAAPGPPGKPAPMPVLCTARVVYDYAKEADGELDLKEGSMVEVLQKADGGWWRGRVGGVVGWFPQHYVEEQSGGGGGAAAGGSPFDAPVVSSVASPADVHVQEAKIAAPSSMPAPVAAPVGSAGRGGGATMQQQFRAFGEQASKAQEASQEVIEELKQIYMAKIRPVEEQYKFDEFYSPLLNPVDFDAPPMVLMMGQYSVGKTSFIRYLLERSFPGERIGPEPTTDRFVAVMHGREEKCIPGNAAAVAPDRPFSALNKFGADFLSKFEVSLCPSPILEKLFFVDTPGVLSGEKQRIGRQYDFSNVIEWFAQRADRILLLFDAHKLDISDEFKGAIDRLRGHDDKIRVVMNKADMVTNQQLMRIYGALMWSLGKVVKTPEVLRVYVGSFWDQPLNDKGRSNEALFRAEQEDLLSDLRGLPRGAAVRKVNELIKRARLAKVHALIISHLKAEMPGFFGNKKKMQAKLQSGLLDEFKKVMKANNIPAGDFPNIDRFRSKLLNYDISKFSSLKKKLLEQMEITCAQSIPSLLSALPGINVDDDGPINEGGAAAGDNPFAAGPTAQASQGWVVSSVDKGKYDSLFHSIGPSGYPPKLTGQQCFGTLSQSGLPRDSLKKIWDLSDIDKDGYLDADEFSIAMFLADQARIQGSGSIPGSLPPHFVPPSKR